MGGREDWPLGRTFAYPWFFSYLLLTLLLTCFWALCNKEGRGLGLLKGKDAKLGINPVGNASRICYSSTPALLLFGGKDERNRSIYVVLICGNYRNTRTLIQNTWKHLTRYWCPIGSWSGGKSWNQNQEYKVCLSSATKQFSNYQQVKTSGALQFLLQNDDIITSSTLFPKILWR